MSTAEQVSELLLLWEELREQGRPADAEELCRDCPHLLDEVRRRIAALEAVYRVPNRLPAATQAEPGDGAEGPPAEPPRVAGYEILGVLGSGGMGVVYKARDLRLKRLVALKMILTGPHARPQELARFKREAEAVARLQHPNVVQIYEVGEQDGRPYLALEYVDGGSLADRLAGRPQPPDEAARLVRALALAVHAAHEHGLVHRDLKPANVLLQKRTTTDNTDNTDEKKREAASSVSSVLSVVDFVPKIADFGLAKRLDEAGLTETGSVLGTPTYMAPEQALGDSRGVGPPTDVYALGAILYELLTGRPPFEGATLLETLEQVRSREPQRPALLRPGVPRDLETVCLKCLEKEPARRYPSALALADDLGRFLDGKLIQARSFTLVDRLVRSLNRSREIDQFQAVLRPIAAPLLIPLPFLVHLLPFLLLRGTPAFPPVCLAVTLGLLALSLVVALWLFWAGRVFPHTPALAQLLSMRAGHLVGMLLVPLVCRALLGPDGPWELASYPFLSILTGTLMFAMGSWYWGRLYLAGAVFFALALVMPYRLEWGPVEFGLAVSGLMGGAMLHLRRIDSAAGTAPGVSSPTRVGGKS
jgi:serine/threonine protein kinase